MTQRASGVLLHPTCLAGRYGIGDFGESALIFLDWLQEAGQTVWQILPLGPVGQGHSPYDAKSSYAGNPLLIALPDLVRRGLLVEDEIEPSSFPYSAHADFDLASRWKSGLLRRAWGRIEAGEDPTGQATELRRWIESPQQAQWLDDWTLFAALKTRFASRSWTDWPADLRQRASGALEQARTELTDEIRYQEFVQFLFFDQLAKLRSEAEKRGISLLGDLPFYVGQDSCDVWTHQHLFDLDESGLPRFVAGVPPDYFSATGQRWGNPTYRWDRLADQGYQWWIERLARQLVLVDRLRLDHFLAFAEFWEIPAAEPTAVSGRWRQGPGLPLFEAANASLGSLPFVAEDLGLITPDVEELRVQLGIPGIRVLQFAFDSPESPHLPHNLSPDVVLYTGTHDNDTARGWIESIAEDVRQRVFDYLGATTESFCWDLLRAAQTSIAELVITPIQDVAGLDGRHRLNTPGTTIENWSWRLPQDALTDELARKLRRITDLADRLPPSHPSPARPE